MNFPDKQYSVIYADPPWSYRQHGTGPKSRGNAAQHYHTMNVEDICSLPVRRLAGGGYWMCPIHVGDLPDASRCPAGNGELGLHLQNRSLRLGKDKQEEQHPFLGHGSIHPRKCRNLPPWGDARFQCGEGNQKSFRASNH